MRLFLTSFLVLLAALAIGQGARRPFVSAYMLINPAVQTELKLSAAQRALVKTLTARPAPLPAQKVGNADEIRKHFEAMAKKREQDQEKIMASLTAAQKGRLKQISLQMQGITVVSVPEVAKELGLTADQQRRVAALTKKRTDTIRKTISKSSNAKMTSEQTRKYHQDMIKNVEARMARYRQIQKADEIAIMTMLTPQQKQKWRQMLGKPFSSVSTRAGG